MRQRIDISEVEARTKIRAKYLRALENEEWELLPGPTFVKSFLRTYAEVLDLDARLLLEEYKLRHEHPSEHELLPIAPPGRRDTRRGPSPGIGRDVLVAVAVVAVVGLLIVLGSGSDDEGDRRAATTQTTARQPVRTTTTPREPKAKPAPRFARLQVLPEGPVWICLRAAGGRVLIPGEVVEASSRLPAWRSSEFIMTLGNGSVRMRVNGKTLNVPEVQEPIGYRIDQAGRRTELGEDERPTCA